MPRSVGFIAMLRGFGKHRMLFRWNNAAVNILEISEMSRALVERRLFEFGDNPINLVSIVKCHGRSKSSGNIG